MSNKLLLVDGSAYIFRAFHALPLLTRADGTPTNAVRGFVSMLIKLMDTYPDDPIAVIFDPKGGTFRNEMYDQYKANRSAPPEELVPQFPLVRDATRALNLPCIERKGYEADDVMATYARQASAGGRDVVIVSSDKDLMQLVTDKITMLDPMKNIIIGIDQVVEKFGVTPDKMIDLQAMAGDSVDNIPGVAGIGPKTAAQLLNEYGDLDTLLARVDEIKQPKRRQTLIDNADNARLSRELVRLVTDMDLSADPWQDFTREDPDPGELTTFLEEMEFRSIAQRLGLALAAPEGPGGAGDAVPPEELPAIDRDVYELVTDAAHLQRWIDEARTARVVAFDCESTGLDAVSADLVGVSLSTGPGRACYVPLAHKGKAVDDLLSEPASDPVQVPFDEALVLLRPLLCDPAVLKVGHNLKYDALLLARHDVTIAPLDDTMLLSFTTAAGQHNHGLDDLADRHFGHQCIKFSAVAGTGKKQVTFDQVSLDDALAYAAEDAEVAWRLHHHLKPALRTQQVTHLYETTERPLVPVLCAMERRGIKVDRERLAALSNEFATRSVALEKQIHELAGEEFKIGSPKQLGDILFGKMGFEGGKKGKTGAYSTDASVLEGLAAQGHDLPKLVVDWRQVNKLKSTYTDALQAQINPVTGRVHTSYHMAGAATGRLSSNDPNLQNIPVRTEDGRKIREAFIAEPGHKLLSVDYSQIELRITAHVAEEPALRQAFHDGTDIHAMTASEMFGVPVEGMDPMVRRQAKAINFGIIYGISAFGLANNLGIGRDEAKSFIETYFARFGAIQDYMAAAKTFAHDHGYVQTLFGRKIFLPGIKDKIPAKRAFAERQAINAPIQGAAADVIKRAMIRMDAALAGAGLKARMLLQVHDELLFEVPEEEMEQTSALVREVMEAAAAPAVQLSVPLVADAGFGDTWREAH